MPLTQDASVTDLFLLSRTDAIVGSDSSFGAFAAWYGNISHIIAKSGPMDWSYYAGKKGFFASLADAFDGADSSMRTMGTLSKLENAPVAHAVMKAITDAPRGAVEMKATNLPVE